MQRDEFGNPIVPLGLTRRGLLVNGGVLGLGTMGLGAFLTACGSSSEPGNEEMDAVREGGTLTFGIDGTNGVADPALYTTLGDWMAVDSISAGLVAFDFTTGERQWALAQDSSVSDDGLVVSVKLREGVLAHDGTTLSSTDVVRTFNRQLVDGDPTLPQTSTRPMRGSLNRNVAEVRAVDDLTVEFQLLAPDAVFLSRLGDISCRIVSAAALDASGADIGQQLVGHGAYKVVELVPQQSITLEAFADYFGGAPALDRLVLQQIADSSSLNAGLQSGQVNASSFVAHSSADSLGQNPNVTIEDSLRSVDVFVMMNVTTPVLSDLRVRQAVNLAINREEIVEKAFYGYADVPDGYALPKNRIGYDASLADLSEFDEARAKALVEEAGATGAAVSLIAQNNNWYPLAAQIIEANLKAIGLVPNVELLDPGSFSGRFFDLEGHELALWERNGYVPDADDMVGKMLASTGSYANRGTGHATLDPAVVAQVDTLLNDARQTTDDAERTDLYSQAQRLFAEQFMAMAMVACAQNVVASNGCQDIGTPALSAQRMQMEKAALTA
ncbi:ABC transporter substrate-binding protein [Kineococcus sp. SYSU DK003]|uniref:ABC transporter substrate-binding protein n=1 Tax=Kineococcus sp. SYSU DK003 TaxID=3383124 RepID=UPI003D7DD21A